MQQLIMVFSENIIKLQFKYVLWDIIIMLVDVEFKPDVIFFKYIILNGYFNIKLQTL